jgi:glycosyltransferase involved in cell wall biosynthesis
VNVNRKQVCIVATVPFALRWFMSAHIKGLSKFYDVTLVTNGRAEDLLGLLGDNVSFVPIQIERKISIKNDFVVLIKLYRLFRINDFDCVHSIFPKSGLLAMLAANLAGVPIRIHTFTGQVWVNKRGFRRRVLKYFDKVLAMNATKVLADSTSQRKFLIDNKVVKKSSIIVLANGSVAGVDLERFKFKEDVRNEIRKQNGIRDDAIVFLFLGRLSKDKGLVDLFQAFAIVAKSNEDIHLLIVGPDEAGLEVRYMELFEQFPGQVHRIGYTICPEDYMSASDVLCLPSYREGFGTVIIEAASVGLPSIASRIYGITDAVVDGMTGILHQPASDSEIADAMSLLVSDGALRRRMGEAARDRVINKFSAERLSQAFMCFYQEIFLD